MSNTISEILKKAVPILKVPDTDAELDEPFWLDYVKFGLPLDLMVRFKVPFTERVQFEIIKRQPELYKDLIDIKPLVELQALAQLDPAVSKTFGATGAFVGGTGTVGPIPGQQVITSGSLLPLAPYSANYYPAIPQQAYQKVVCRGNDLIYTLIDGSTITIPI